MPLTTLAKVKTHNDIVGDEQNSLINQLIPQMESFFEAQLGRGLTVTTEVDKILSYKGNGILQLKMTPVVSISGITFNNSAFSATRMERVQFQERTGTVYLENLGRANDEFFAGDFIIQYIAGFSTIPPDLEMAANEAIGEMVNNPGATSLRAAKLGNYSYQKFARTIGNAGVSDLVSAAIDNNKMINR